MHVLSRTESLDESRVLAEVRHQTKLDLRIVGTEEGTAFVRYEGLTDSTPFGGADGDVLDVGITAGEATGSSDGLIEGRVDLAIGIDQFGQGLDIGAEELLHPSVVKDLPDDGMLVPKLLQHLFACGVASGLSLLGLVDDLELVEEHFAYLLTAVDIDRMADEGVDLFLEKGKSFLELLGLTGKTRFVQAHALPLHPEEHKHQGHLDLLEELRESRLLHSCREVLIEEVGNVGVLGSVEL